MAKFEVVRVFRLPSQSTLAVSGHVREGVVKPGMSISVWLDGGAYWTIPVEGVEFVDHVSSGQSEVALVSRETHPEQFAWLEGLCKPGDVVEVK